MTFLLWLLRTSAPTIIKLVLKHHYGLNAAQAALGTPKVIAGVKEFVDVFRMIRGKGISDETAMNAADWIVLRPQREWTPQEEQRWMDRDKSTMG